MTPRRIYSLTAGVALVLAMSASPGAAVGHGALPSSAGRPGVLPSATGRTGRGIKIGKALLSPYAILDATYDTNPGLARYSDSEEDTVFYQGSLVLGLTLPTRLFTLSASGFVSYRDYLDDVTQGENIYGDELAYDGWTYGFSGAEGFSISAGDPDRLQFDFAQSYERVEDYSQQTSADFLRNEYTQDTYLLEARGAPWVTRKQ